MEQQEIRTLKVGDPVVWPEGANGCTAADGVVVDSGYTNHTGEVSRFIQWTSDEITYLSDLAAMTFVQKAAS